MIFRLHIGDRALEHINTAVVYLVDAAMEGHLFLFGPLSLGPGSKGSLGLILAFQVLPAIVVFSALIALVYHFGVMQKILHGFYFLFNRLMKLSGAESLCAGEQPICWNLKRPDDPPPSEKDDII